MERAEVLQVLREKAVEMLEVSAEDVQEDASFTDLKVDSLYLVEYTMDLEDVFDVELPEEELAEVKTIGGFADLILAKSNDA
jgi:acyl carrier protein